MTIEKINMVEKYNNAMNAVVATHNDLKIKSQIAYSLAVEHGQISGDWFCLADFITKMLINRITAPKHLLNILKATNKGLVYNREKQSISQNKDFDKNTTVVLSSIWADELTETTKQAVVVFDEKKLFNSLQIALSKAIKNNMAKETIKQQVALALGWLESK